MTETLTVNGGATVTRRIGRRSQQECGNLSGPEFDALGPTNG